MQIRQTIKTININIAGIAIQFIFKNNQYQESLNSFIESIAKSYHGFIVSNPKKVNYRIYFIEKSSVYTLYKSKCSYINFYCQRSPTSIITFYYISLWQLQLLIRNILLKILCKRNGLLLHASGIIFNNQAYIFCGSSGTGKSTMVNLLKKKGAFLADDCLILKNDKDKYFCYQTPFIEKVSTVKSNQKYLLNCVFIINRSNSTAIKLFNNKHIIFARLLKLIITEKQYYSKNSQELLNFVDRFNKFYILKNESLPDMENLLSRFIN